MFPLIWAWDQHYSASGLVPTRQIRSKCTEHMFLDCGKKSGTSQLNNESLNLGIEPQDFLATHYATDSIRNKKGEEISQNSFRLSDS